MPRKLHTPPLTIIQLRRAWVERPESRDLLAEIYRLHCVLQEINELRAIIEASYTEHCGGKLVALHRFKLLLSKEPALDRLYPDKEPKGGG